jgi:hypothetical protein
MYIGSILPGILLLLLTILVFLGFLQVLLTNQQLTFQALLAGLVLGLAWWLYMQLPEFIRQLFRTIWNRPKRKDRFGH